MDVVHINPGIFALMYLLGLPAITHLGMLALPFGDGRNAPPSNEDIARVGVGVLTNPGPHIGTSYRPTGPELVSSHDIAGILTDVVGRKVRYQDTSFRNFAKAAQALGYQRFEIAQIRHYAEEIRNGAYEIGAPTDHVEAITGQKPEPFESIARRYVNNPSLIHPKLSKGGKVKALAFVLRMMVQRVQDFDRWERENGCPILREPVFAQDSEEWRKTAEKQQLNLFSI